MSLYTNTVACIIDAIQFKTSFVLTMSLAELYIWSIMHVENQVK